MKNFIFILITFLTLAASAEVSAKVSSKTMTVFANPATAKYFNDLSGDIEDTSQQKYLSMPQPPNFLVLSPRETAVALPTLQLNKVHRWDSYEQVLQAFEVIKNLRAYEDPTVENFPRRIPWLYWTDGCFVRAGLAAQILDQVGFPDVSQLFIFRGGNNWHLFSYQDVEWRYHVAPTVRVGQTVYVLDVAMNPSGPLKYQDWLGRFVRGLEKTEIRYGLHANICSEAAWHPDGECFQTNFSTPVAEDGGGKQRFLLTLDWWRDRLLHIERRQLETFYPEKADEYLGDEAPWGSTPLRYTYGISLLPPGFSPEVHGKYTRRKAEPQNLPGPSEK